MSKITLAIRYCKEMNSLTHFTPTKKLLVLLFIFATFLPTENVLSQGFSLGSLQNLTFPTQMPRTSTATSSAPTTTARKVVESGKEQAISDSIKSARSASSVAPVVDSAAMSIRKKLYGFNIFNNPNISFETSLKIPTPKNYILGTDDELLIDINGFSEEHYNLPITSEGYIKVPKVGNIFVSGITIEEAKRRITDRLSKIYVGLKSYNGAAPNTTATVSLGSIRTIRVSILGDVVAPGTYSVSSLSRVMNALYLAGGPNENGTFREIKVIRDKKLIAQVDLYDLLTTGNLRQNISLQDQDIIQVGSYKSRVEIKGQIKKPAIFENLPNESLERIIAEYGNGFLPDAYRQVLKVQRFTDKEIKLIDLNSDLLSSFYPKSGDVITVEQILTNRIENAVTLDGAVFRSGRYSINDNPTLTKLIKRAEGFKQDAFLKRISITRLREDLTKENISVNYNDIVSGKTPDIALHREDIIMVYSVLDLMETYTVRIQGEINLKGSAPVAPAVTSGSTGVSDTPSTSAVSETPIGSFPYIKNMTVEDLIQKAGGLKESAATGRIEVIRRKKNIGKDDPAQITSTIGEKFNFSINNDLSINETASKFILEPFDEVFVRSSPNYEKQQFVSIEGQVIFPGVYALERKDEKLSEILKRVGGLNAQAYPKGATLIRKFKITKQEADRKRAQLSDLSDNSSGVSVKVEEVKEETEESIGIDLAKALENPGSIADMLLQDGDIIRIPKEPQTVRMQGEVLYPTSTRFLDGMSFKHYISEAGGFTEMSARRRSYIIYANGSVDRTRKLVGLFNIYPKVEPGSEIVVPKLNTKTGATQQLIQTIVAVSTVLSSTVGLLALLRTLK
ncbi:protein involved in polysaccharide export with SLBB domain [Arcicella aurantiaca]|uniref:Protein involved in polysaccharide export with SLBB domain n=1 Tax=Arcicella aurantiaca TaxID=591202 RepID=A0A316E7A3_9BACT|nr:SLBB domain-containing protein [Arcicella aurantiaca]PWK26587.1 protein involved in polysaccharide export with SLBB domain [Arcicella aurantiaca]